LGERGYEARSGTAGILSILLRMLKGILTSIFSGFDSNLVEEGSRKCGSEVIE
jgi:hypothetical protein